MFRNLATIAVISLQFRVTVAFCDSRNAIQQNDNAAPNHDNASAQRDPDRSHKEPPKSAFAMRGLARTKFLSAMQASETNEAYELLKQAYSVDPIISETPQLALARLYAEAGDVVHANEFAQKAAKLGVTDAATCQMIAQTAVQYWDQKIAVEQSKKAVELNPKSLVANTLRGEVAFLSKDYKSAKIYYAEALRLSPDDRAIRDAMSLTLCEQDDDADKLQALKYCESYLLKHPDDIDGKITYGRVLFRLKRFENAEKAVRGIDTKKAALNSEKRYYIAAILAARGRKLEAAELMKLPLSENSSQTFLDRKDPPGSRKDDMVLLLKQMFADSGPKGLKKGEKVIVISHRTYEKDIEHIQLAFPGGTLLTVAWENDDGGAYVTVAKYPGEKWSVLRADLARP